MKNLTLILLSVIISSVVWAGDVHKSDIHDYHQFFDKDSCDQVLTDTFTICYSHKRKSAKAVYVKIYGDKVFESKLDNDELFQALAEDIDLNL